MQQAATSWPASRKIYLIFSVISELFVTCGIITRCLFISIKAKLTKTIDTLSTHVCKLEYWVHGPWSREMEARSRKRGRNVRTWTHLRERSWGVSMLQTKRLLNDPTLSETPQPTHFWNCNWAELRRSFLKQTTPHSLPLQAAIGQMCAQKLSENVLSSEGTDTSISQHFIRAIQA